MPVENLRALGAVAAAAIFVQMLSASFQGRSFETPNHSTVIAENLARTGTLAIPNADGSTHQAPGTPGAMRRAYQLPGEPVYLSAGLRLPEILRPYLHVPVTTIFIVGIAAVGMLVAGRAVGLVAGFIAGIDPFVLAHGPVWDDTFLAAALEWSAWALVLAALSSRAEGRRWSIGGRWGTIVVVCAMAAAAALTRAQSQVVLAAVGIAIVATKRLRSIRSLGFAMVVGVVIGVGAWGVRNASVLGRFYVGSTHDGKGLLDANCATTRDSILTTGWVGARICSPSLAQRLPSLGELDADREHKVAAWDYVTSHPWDAASTAVFKLAVSFSGYDFGSRAVSARNLVGAGASLLVLCLGAIGLWGVARHAPATPVRGLLLAIFYTTAVATTAMLLVGPVGLRYRIDLTGFLYLGAAVAVSSGASEPFGKRALDVTLSGIGLLVSTPIWAAVALAIKLEDRGPIFYTQDRVGRHGRVFRVFKFRSMIPDAEARVGALQAAHGDSRITRVGRLLRATAADELPQLWNIFRGDMSFVGPRALRPGEIEVHGDGQEEALEDVPGFAERCRVRPGLTGVAQIYAARDIPRRYKFQYDKLYLRRQSFGLDVRLILLSFWITFRGTWEVRGKKF